MTRIRTILAGLLAAIFCAATFAVPAAAATPTDHHKYSRYLAIGDSWNAKSTAYPTILAKALGTKLSLPDCTGYRTQELRFLLEDDYEGDELMFQFGAASPKKAAKSGPKLRKLIGKAKLMTIQVGANDIFSNAIAQINRAAGAQGQDFTASMKNAIRVGYQNFVKNWDTLIGDIYELNPDVTLVAVGMMNPFEKLQPDDAELQSICRTASFYTQLVNAHISVMSRYAEDYLYIDVTGAETYEVLPNVSNERLKYVVPAVYPTSQGHRDIAGEILDALPLTDEVFTTNSRLQTIMDSLGLSGV